MYRHIPNKKILVSGLEYEKVCTYIQSFADDESGRLFRVSLAVVFISHLVLPKWQNLISEHLMILPS